MMKMKPYDPRPQRFGWAPGTYLNTCRECKQSFEGDKRASMCADCAYSITPEYIERPELTKNEGECNVKDHATLLRENEELRNRIAIHDSDIKSAHRKLDEAGVTRTLGEKELTVSARIDSLRDRVKELEAQVDSHCNESVNIADILRSRGFQSASMTGLLQRVIAMAQDRDAQIDRVKELEADAKRLNELERRAYGTREGTSVLSLEFTGPLRDAIDAALKGAK